MKLVIVFGLLLLLVGSTVAYAARKHQQPQHTRVGEFRFHRQFASQFLQNRDVLVYLPPGYEQDTKRRYPVFYMHDGQNLFDGATSYIPGQEWRVDETVDSLIRAKKLPPLIVVGIYNTGPERVNEYAPTRDAKYKVGGKADLYGQMLVEELKPFIDKNYRTRPDAANTGLGGSSLGGLVSIYLGLKYPNVFGKLAVLSPSVWFGDYHILSYLEKQKIDSRARIWLDMGTKEGANAEGAKKSLDNTRLLRDALIKQGWKLDKNLFYFEAEGAGHNERAWAARLEKVLLFLFAR